MPGTITHHTPTARPNDATKDVSATAWDEGHDFALTMADVGGTISDTQHGARGAIVGAHAHADLSGIGANDHHSQLHAHATHTGIAADDHHAQSHAHNGADGTGTVAHASTSGITATDHHAAPVAGPDANITVDAVGAAGTAATFARSAHGHQVVTTDAPSGANVTIDAAATAAATGAIARAAHGHRMNTSATAALAVGTASAGTSGHSPSRDDHVHPTGAGTPSTQAFGDAAAIGAGPAAAMTDHKHAMPADPRPTVAQAAPAQALGTADTYVTNSAITLPSGLRVGTVLRWQIFVTKTAAGVAAPIIQIRFGTNGTTADTSRVSITGNAQTGVVDSGCFEIVCVVTATGATGNVLGMMFLQHQLATTGLSLGNWGQQALSANFDLTVAATKAGISMTPGASAAWTVNRVVTRIEP